MSDGASTRVPCSSAAPPLKENRAAASGLNRRVQELEKELNDQRVAAARRVRALEARLQVSASRIPCVSLLHIQV